MGRNFEPKTWYSLRWYDINDVEHYYSGGWNYMDVVDMATDALESIHYIAYLKLFANDSYIAEFRRKTNEQNMLV